MAKVGNKVVERTVHASKLLKYFEKYQQKYGGDYPMDLSAKSLMNGIDYVLVKMIGEQEGGENLALYILEEGDETEDAKYVITVASISSGRSGTSQGYAIQMFYLVTQELESLSTIEPGKVVWSPDNMSNTAHPLRTKYYFGLIYLIAEKTRMLDGK